MKIIKNIVFIFIGLIAFILVIALFTQKNYALKREITINRSKEIVFDYVKLLKNQDNFSVWAQMDPNMKKEFRGTDGTVGFVSSWDSENENVGKGEQEIKKIVDGERIDFELRFYEPFEATDNAYITAESLNDSITKVVWGFDGSFAYPMNLMLLFMDMNEMVGKDLREGLDNLKVVLEK